MTAPGASAREASALAPRVLWVEGPTPSLGDGAAAARLALPRLAEEDARVAFAVALAPGRALALPALPWAAGAPLPPAGDARWEAAAFESPGRRLRDRHLVVRRSTLARWAGGTRGGDAAVLAAALESYLAPQRRWRIAGRELLLRRSRPAVMAVLNVTPDSFSDGGRWNALAAVARGEELVAAGAALLDVGGESTRPGSLPVSAAQELERVLPVIEGLARRVATPISVDTTKAEVALAALSAGASIVNDTSALADDPALADVAAARGAGVILMHRAGPPRTMQDDPRYDDCAGEVAEQLAARAAFAIGRAIARESIVLDPGLGFGKRLEDNLDLVAAIGSLRSLGFPVLLGASRKSFLGALTGRPVHAREAATLATTAAAFQSGCDLVRVHDAAGSADLLAVLAALRGGAAQAAASAAP